MNEANYKVLTNIIGAVETGGQVYGKQRYDAYAAAYTNSPKEYTCTLGAFQFYGSEAKQLIQMIYNANPTEFKSIDTKGVIQAKLSTDWVATRWNPSSSQKSILIKLITTLNKHKTHLIINKKKYINIIQKHLLYYLNC